jgi:hypothetical protein
MSVMDMNSRMAMAEKLSIPQLQQAVQSGSIPAYIGIPLIEQKTKERAQMAAAQQGQQAPSVAAQILQQADAQEQQERGIDELPSNLPMMEDEEMGMAGGGIVAFANGNVVEDRLSPSDRALDALIAQLNAYRNSNRAAPQSPQTVGVGAEGDMYDPVAEGASPGAQDPDFVGSQTGGGAYVGYRRQRGAGSGTPKGRGAVLPRQDLSQLAFDYEEPVTTSPAATQAGLIGEMQDPGGAAVAGIGVPSRGNRPDAGRGAQGTDQGAQGAGGAPTARQTAQPTQAQAQAAQPEGQSALDKYAAMLMAEREGSGKEREKAKGMAIFQAGLGIMGGTSPNALANIAQGALPATQAYQQEIKGIRREDAARLKELMGLGVSKEKLALEAKKLGISEKRFDQMYELEKQKIGIMGGQRADARSQAEEMKRLTVAQGLFGKFLDKNPMPTDAERAQMWTQAQQMAGMTGAASTDTIPTISSPAEYAKLPKGTQYRDPKGVLRTKG